MEDYQILPDKPSLSFCAHMYKANLYNLVTRIILKH